jgi:GNAT superfamily N-acetyltransferase
MEFRFIQSEEEARRIFPVMNELRDHLDEQTFLKVFDLAKSESGYVLIGAYDNRDCLGLMGFRILTDFVHGRHLYVDDLVISEKFRSNGLGSQFLKYAKKIAEESDCKRLRLCTGIQNEKGKTFYERNGWDLRAVVYKTKI